MIASATSAPRLLTLILLTALSMLSLNMFLPSLAVMATEFGVSYSIMNLSIAGYLGVTAMLQIILGPLSDRYGRRPVFMASITVFICASLVCYLATDIWIFLTFRILQGAIITGMTLSRAIVRDMMAPQDAIGMLSTIGMAMAVAPMVGPIFGGLLGESLGWRSTFLFYIIAGLFMFWLTYIDLGETNKNPSPTFRKQFSNYPEVLRSKRFWGYSLTVAFGVGSYFAFLSGAPLIANTVLNMPPSYLGFFMGSITFGFFVGSFIARQISDKVEMNTLIVIGRAISVIGLAFGVVLILLGIVTPLSVFGTTVFIGLANGISLPACNYGVMSVRSDLAGSASGLSGAMTVAFGAILASITGAVLTPENAVLGFMCILFLCNLLSFIFGIWTRNLEIRHVK